MEGSGYLLHIQTTPTLTGSKQPFNYCSSWPWTLQHGEGLSQLYNIYSLLRQGQGGPRGRQACFSVVSDFSRRLSRHLSSMTTLEPLDFLWLGVFRDTSKGSCQSPRALAQKQEQHHFSRILLVKALTEPTQSGDEEINPYSSGRCVNESDHLESTQGQ